MRGSITNTLKQALRRQVLERVQQLTAAQRAAASMKACLLIEEQAVWKKAGSLLFYAPMPEELDVWRLVQDSVKAGKLVALPRFDRAARRYVACRIQNLGADVGSGHFGIREPAAHCASIGVDQFDLVLVPGVAFDARGGRLGRGKGYYDALLVPVQGAKCGVGFDQQLVPEIPVEPHDIRLDYVLTPSRWVQCI